MTIAELIEFTSNLLGTLNEARTTAVRAGNLSEISRLDADIAVTENTLSLLRAIPSPVISP